MPQQQSHNIPNAQQRAQTQTQKAPLPHRVFIQHMPIQMTASLLRRFLEENFGGVESINMPSYEGKHAQHAHATGMAQMHKGVAFVVFKSAEAAAKCCNGGNRSVAGSRQTEHNVSHFFHTRYASLAQGNGHGQPQRVSADREWEMAHSQAEATLLRQRRAEREHGVPAKGHHAKEAEDVHAVRQLLAADVVITCEPAKSKQGQFNDVTTTTSPGSSSGTASTSASNQAANQTQVTVSSTKVAGSTVQVAGSQFSNSQTMRANQQAFQNMQASPSAGYTTGGGKGGASAASGGKGAGASASTAGGSAGAKGKGKGKAAMGRRIFVTKIDPTLTEGTLRQYFEQFGALDDLFVPRKNPTVPHDKRHKSIAFVTFRNQRDYDEVTSRPRYEIRRGMWVVVDAAKGLEESSGKGTGKGGNAAGNGKQQHGSRSGNPNAVARQTDVAAATGKNAGHAAVARTVNTAQPVANLGPAPAGQAAGGLVHAHVFHRQTEKQKNAAAAREKAQAQAPAKRTVQ
jgi:RNA recognition motif-containing protein